MWGWSSTALVLIGVGGVAAAPEVSGHATGLLALPGLVGLILAPLTLDAGYGHTVLSPHGIRTHKLFSRHSCPWSEVTGIDTLTRRGGRGPTESRIVVLRSTGKPFRLAAPLDSTNGRDPQFRAKFGQILNYWADVRTQLAGR
jgi:hypothetical protein